MPSRSAAERRRDEKVEFEAFLASCPSRKLLDRISDKWVTLVVVSLADGPMRYAEISRRLAGVSQKMLTQTLRSLERDGLVKRTVTASVPVRVDYQLTALGLSLLGPIREIKRWAELHMKKVDAAQQHYDAKNAVP